jgi:single-stranded-DNA-specific exonuclease
MEQGETSSTGSARSIKGFDIVAALNHCSEYLLKYGGHKEAAGLTVANDQFDNFYFNLLKYAENNWPEQSEEPILELDAKLEEQDLSMDRYEEIALLEPFGMGNPKPKFLIEDAKLISHRLVGQSQNHLQMQVLVGETILECIGFSMGYFSAKLETGKIINLAGELIADTWNGNKKLKMRIIDIQIKQPELSEIAEAGLEELITQTNE